MIRFSVKLEGVEGAVDKLDARIDALGNLKEFFDGEAGEIIRRHEVEVMMTSGHGQHPPLAESTVKRTGRRPPFHTPSKKMWHDLTSKNAPYHIHEATDTGLVEGTDNPIAPYHIKRRTRPGTRWVLPMRRLVYWVDDVKGRLTAALVAFLRGRERIKGYARKGVARYGR